MNRIPDKNRSEWGDLLLGKINLPLDNFFFQMKITQLRSLLNKNQLTLGEAVDDIYNLCVKFSNAKNMSSDLEKIFGKDTFITDDVIFDNSSSIAKTAEKTDNISNLAEKNTAKLQKKLEEIARQKFEMERKIFELKKAKEEAEKKAKLEKKIRSMEMEQKSTSNANDNTFDDSGNTDLRKNDEKSIDPLEDIYFKTKRKKKKGFFRSIFRI